MGYRYVKDIDAWLNTKTGLYIYPEDDEYSEVLKMRSRKLDANIRKLTIEDKGYVRISFEEALNYSGEVYAMTSHGNFYLTDIIDDDETSVYVGYTKTIVVGGGSPIIRVLKTKNLRFYIKK